MKFWKDLWPFPTYVDVHMNTPLHRRRHHIAVYGCFFIHGKRKQINTLIIGKTKSFKNNGSLIKNSLYITVLQKGKALRAPDMHWTIKDGSETLTIYLPQMSTFYPFYLQNMQKCALHCCDQCKREVTTGCTVKNLIGTSC